ncbi:MAG: hypothetical protein Q6L58_03085 [Thermostichales cyanobacterium BF3_bins_165]
MLTLLLRTRDDLTDLLAKGKSALEEGQLKNVEVPKNQNTGVFAIDLVLKIKNTLTQTQNAELERLMRAVQGSQNSLIDDILVHFDPKRIAEDLNVPKEKFGKNLNNVIAVSISVICHNLGRSANEIKTIWFDFGFSDHRQFCTLFLTRETRHNSYYMHSITSVTENPSVENCMLIFPINTDKNLGEKVWNLLQSNLTKSNTWKAFDYLLFAIYSFDCSLILNSTLELDPAKAVVRVYRGDTSLAFGIEKRLDNSVFLIQDGQEDFFETRSDLMSAVMLYISRLILHYQPILPVHNLPSTVTEYILQTS